VTTTTSDTAAGTAETRLIVVRGNSGSGKSRTAQGIRASFGRGIAWVGQDNLRRVVLRERDRDHAVMSNVGLIGMTARYALDAGYHVVVEGILYADRYGPMLRQLGADHRGSSHFFYLDIPLEETFRRHATKPEADVVGEDDLRDWYRHHDLLPDVPEHVIGADSSLDETIALVMAQSGLPPGGGDEAGDGPAVAPARVVDLTGRYA
jgi:predicted kinase